MGNENFMPRSGPDSELGNLSEESMPGNSEFGSGASYDSRRENNQLMRGSSRGESGTRRGLDGDLGNAAEDEMTREPEGDIF